MNSATLDVYDLFSFVFDRTKKLHEIERRLHGLNRSTQIDFKKCCEVECVWQSHDIPKKNGINSTRSLYE